MYVEFFIVLASFAASSIPLLYPLLLCFLLHSLGEHLLTAV